MPDPAATTCPECASNNRLDAKFCNECGARLTLNSDSSSPGIREPKTNAIEASRRHLTVLFCDLVGSVAMSQSLDVEELRERLTEYHQICSHAADQFDGHVAQYLGDGVLIYFGYPRAQEDSARRAMKCGLLILSQLARRSRQDLVARLGADSGLVLMSDVGSGATHEELALGDTPNIAARIQSMAQPGTLFVSDRTWQLAQAYFLGTPLGSQTIKGVQAPLDIWTVTAESSARNRVEGMQGGLSPFVGRTEQLNLISELIEAPGADVRVTDIRGEPGIGKSRIIMELQDQPCVRSRRILYSFCTADAEDTPFGALMALIRDLLNIAENLTGHELRAQIQTGLEQVSMKTDERVGLICHVLGTDETTAGLTALDGMLIGRRTRSLIVALIEAAAAKQSTLLMIEDLHWIDASSEETIYQLLAASSNKGLRVVTTRRPEKLPSWLKKHYLQTIELNPLAPDACEQILSARLPDGTDPAWLATLVERSDGNALFAEELAAFYTKDGADKSSTTVVPDSITALLAARVEAMAGEARRVLQLGSAIGRQFTLDLMNSLIVVEPMLETVLNEAVQSELLRRTHRPNEYQFKHALIQDTLYGTMLRPQRAQAHLDIAEALESNYNDRQYEAAEQLAHHYSRSGNDAKALTYLIIAGEKNMNNFALEEAKEHLDAALSLVEEGKAQASPEELIRLLRHHSELHRFQFKPKELVDSYHRMRPRIDPDLHNLDYVVYLNNLVEVLIWSRQYDLAATLGRQAMAVASKLDSPIASAYATSCHLFAQTHLSHSDVTFAQRKRLTEQALADARALSDTNLEIFILGASAWDYLFRGLTAQGNRCAEELAALGERVDDPRATIFALTFTGWLYIGEERFEEALQIGRTCMDAAATPFVYHIGEQIVGFALTALGKPQEGLALFNEYFKKAESIGFEYIRMGCAAGRAIALVLVGKITEGLNFLEQEIAESDRIDDPHGKLFQRVFGAELLIEILLSEDKPSLRVLITNLPKIIQVQISGARQAEAMLKTASESPFIEEGTLYSARIDANLAMLYALTKRNADSKRAIERAQAQLGIESSWQPIRARLDRAKAILAR